MSKKQPRPNIDKFKAENRELRSKLRKANGQIKELKKLLKGQASELKKLRAKQKRINERQEWADHVRLAADARKHLV